MGTYGMSMLFQNAPLLSIVSIAIVSNAPASPSPSGPIELARDLR